jgi:hypothetical protein
VLLFTHTGVIVMIAAGWDSFDHLRQALFWEPGDMVIPLTAYFDASGTGPDKPVWAIGGWIADVDQWCRVKRDWRQMIDEAPFSQKVKPKDRIFHATDLESQVGIYSGWSKEQKEAFQNRAYSIIKDYQLFPFSSAIVKTDFEALKLHFDRLPEGHAGNFFIWTFHHVMSRVCKWLEAQNKEVSIHYIFERGQLGDGEIQNSLRRMASDPKERDLYRLRDWTFAGKEILPLQTADVWAYESCKQMENQHLSGALRPVRYPWKRLYRAEFAPYQTYFNRENLLPLLAEYKKRFASK